ncbi:TraB/GumN family protein [Chitinophaga japonensis]|uniref:TraB family protein n=1 Tax=Chitinophaga japonensis TaxID=104662 RepID=A0A562T5N7_CHIJA|nr:TraB/GumN family protein [Chitinophaga japonensis]TWI88857.1 hypothetical protein LX66_2944 [Chitinophaga japonensis]
MRILVFLLLGTGILQAQAQSSAGNGERSSLLWKVSGKGLQQPSYLYGTMHLLCEDDFGFPATVTSALKGSRQLFLEINMDDSLIIGKMQELMLMPEGYSFKQLFTPGDYEQLHRFCQTTAGIDISMLDRLKPMAITSVLTLKLFLLCQAPVSAEDELMKLAKAEHKPIRGLERLEDQVAIFDSIPDKEEAAMLMDMLQHVEEDRAKFRDMLAAFRQQDIGKLYTLTLSATDIAPFRDIIVDRRNAEWIPIIAQEMQVAPTFFAFGAGHLGGPKGVIALLREKGYSVEAVSN